MLNIVTVTGPCILITSALLSEIVVSGLDCIRASFRNFIIYDKIRNQSTIAELSTGRPRTIAMHTACTKSIFPDFATRMRQQEAADGKREAPLSVAVSRAGSARANGLSRRCTFAGIAAKALHW